MSASLNFPGVYIEEVPSGVRTITGVATSIAAFVGYTAKGVPNQPTTITSLSDFERSYGGLDRDSPVSYAVRQFFGNGGTQAIIVRVATGAATAAWVLQDDVPTPALDVVAMSPGTWANTLRVSVDRTGARNPDAEFNLVVSQLQPNGIPVPLETHRNLNLDPLSSRFVESVVNDASTLVRAKRRAGLSFADPNKAQGFAVSAALAFPLTVSDSVLDGSVDGNAFHLALTSTPATMAALVTAVTAAIAAAGLAAVLVAKDAAADGSAGTGFLKLSAAKLGESSSVVMTRGASGGLAQVIRLGVANGGREFLGSAFHRPAAVANALPGTLGADGTRSSAVDLVGTALAKTGLNALLDVDLFNILCVPETFDMSDANAQTVAAAAINLCEARRAFYIFDPPSSLTLGGFDTWTPPSSRNAAVYFPPLRLADPLDGLRPRLVAPSGTVAGVYARTDATRGVWKAPAGTDASLNGVLDVGLPLSDAENGLLNPKGINVLRSFPAYGRVVWGARTLRGADAQADEYKYVPVRRLALFLEETLYRSTQWVVFEPNDEPLWAQIRLNIGAFLQGLFRQGAFQGQKPKDAYFVKCDRETTTQADINLGIVNITVGFAPLKPAEFVVIRLQQMAGDIPT